MDHQEYYYDGFQEYYYQDDPTIYHQESLVETLDNSVQQSVDRAVSRALQPYAPMTSLSGHREREGAGPSSKASQGAEQNEPAGASGLVKTWAHSDTMAKFAQSYDRDHEYGAYCLGEKPKSKIVAVTTDTDSDSSHSSLDPSEGKRKRKTKRNKEVVKSHPKVLTFVPEEIVHPKSTDWTPPDEEADHMEARLRKPLEKDIRSKLRSECPGHS